MKNAISRWKDAGAPPLGDFVGSVRALLMERGRSQTNGEADVSSEQEERRRRSAERRAKWRERGQDGAAGGLLNGAMHRALASSLGRVRLHKSASLGDGGSRAATSQLFSRPSYMPQGGQPISSDAGQVRRLILSTFSDDPNRYPEEPNPFLPEGRKGDRS